MKINKKAFTLVEMSIVLIIIGVISTLYVSVTNTINNTKIKIEVAKVTEINTALKSYLITYGELPGVNRGSQVVTFNSNTDAKKILIDRNFITKKAFTIDQKIIGHTDYEWSFIPCKLNRSTNISFHYTSYLISFNYNNLPNSDENNCISIANSKTNSNPWDSFILAYRIFAEYEISLDDNNLIGGSGKIINGYYLDTKMTIFPIDTTYSKDTKIIEWNKESAYSIGAQNSTIKYAIMLK